MKVGEYVRTIKGIGKIEKIETDKQDTIVYLDSGITIDYITKDFTEEEINKMYPSSSKIIKLIEGGDIIHYHNEYIDFISPVIIYDDGEIASNLYDSDGYIFLDKEKDENNIKSIVTKEQFEALEYKCE